MNRERPAFAVPGIPAFLVLLVGMIALVVVVIWYIVNVLAGIEEGEAWLRVIGFIVLLTVTMLWGYLFNGLTPVQPNEARVVVLFGKYDGTLHDPGLRGSTRSRSAEGVSSASATSRARSSRSTTTTATRSRSPRSSSGGSPTRPRRSFEVDDYEHFVHVQTESALRNLATSHPVRRARRGRRRAPIEPGRDRRPAAAQRSRTASRRPASRSSRRASATSPTRRRSPTRCSAASRRPRSSPRARASSRARSAWSRWRSSSCRPRTSSSSTRSARRRWSATCWSCCAREHETQPVVNAGTLYE